MDRRCTVCSTPLSGRKRVLCGSEECAKKRHADRMREWMRDYRESTGERYSSKYESDPKVVAAKAERNRRRNAEKPMRQRYPAQFAAKDARRRMKVAEATVEQFNPIEVFERDGWLCGVCGDPVDPGLKYPDPRSKSLDHIVPIARGGTHSSENAQLAHLRCNILKSDREVMPDGYSWTSPEADRKPERASV